MLEVTLDRDLVAQPIVLLSDRMETITLRENSSAAIPIELTVPHDLVVEEVQGLDELYLLLKTKLPLVENLATRAFVNKEKDAWDDAQRLLYLWNRSDLLKERTPLEYTAIAQSVLRKKMIDVEQAATPKQILESKMNFTPERAVQELGDKAKSHRINNHPLLMTLSEEGLPLDSIRIFMNNYYANNRLFHLFIVTLSLFTPMEKRTELANNFYDEMGGGDTQLAHPVLFFKNFNSLGVPAKIYPRPESLYLANAKTYAAYLSGDYHYGMGGFGCIEITMPGQMTKILAGLRKSGLPERDLEFWDIHISIDLEHGKTWFNEMLSLVNDIDQAEKCLQGGMALLEARATMYDGIWNAINNN